VTATGLRSSVMTAAMTGRAVTATGLRSSVMTAAMTGRAVTATGLRSSVMTVPAVRGTGRLSGATTAGMIGVMTAVVAGSGVMTGAGRVVAAATGGAMTGVGAASGGTTAGSADRRRGGCRSLTM
ncbi:hypothetical protein ACWD33_16365, partial [Streptomyces xiamenensis]